MVRLGTAHAQRWIDDPLPFRALNERSDVAFFAGITRSNRNAVQIVSIKDLWEGLKNFLFSFLCFLNIECPKYLQL